MKSRKVIFAIVAVAMLFSLTVPVFAVSIGDVTTIPEGYRYQRGLIVNNSIPFEAVEKMDSTVIREMMGGGPLEAYSVQGFSVNRSTGAIQPASITSADFSVGVSAQRIYEKGSAYDNFKFMASCFYIDEYVTSRYKDVLAMAWSDEFTLYEDYAIETLETTPGSGMYTDNYDSARLTRKDVNAELGISYNYDLKNHNRYPHSIHMVAKVYKPDETGTAQMTASFAHPIKDCGVDVSFSFPAGVSFTPTVTNGVVEAEPNYTDFTY